MDPNSNKEALAETALGAKSQPLMPQINSQDARQQSTSQQAWSSTQVQAMPFEAVQQTRHLQTTQTPARRRSLSAPTESTRDCQRGADQFCIVAQSNPHNFMGLQPRQSHKNQQQTTDKTRQYPKHTRCSDCCGSGSGGNTCQMGVPIDPQRQDISFRSPDVTNRVAMNYDPYFQQLPQQQQPQQPQQAPQQRLQHNMQYVANDDSLDDFEPLLNSTMIAQDYRDNAGRPVQLVPCSALQQQQQQQMLQQYRSQYGQNQGQSSAACCMPQQPKSVTNQAQYATQQRTQCTNLLDNSYNQTSYRQQPLRAQGKQSGANVTFRDRSTQSPFPVTPPYQPTVSSEAPSRYQDSAANDSRLNQSELPTTANLGRSIKPSCPEKTVTPINYMTLEELYVDRAKTMFFDTLVMDRNCPGIIQDSLDGRENLNQYAFEIAFGDKIPNEPHPVEPMTMLEAIKTRIDYERDQIHKKCRTVREENTKQQKIRADRIERNRDRSGRTIDRDAEYYYYANRDAKNKKGKSRAEMTDQEMMSEDIDRHFSAKNKSEVNESILAFLKAENDHSSHSGHASKNFSANVNSHESNILGLPIKTKVYTATTWPID